MTLPVGTILRVVASLLWTDGEVLQNVFNAVITGAGGPFDEDDVVDDMEQWLSDMYVNFGTYMTDNIDGSECIVYEYDSVDDDWDEVGRKTFTFNPTNTGHYFARGNAALINAKTLDPDVSGKKYFGGFTEDSGQDGLWGGALLAVLATVLSEWATGFVGAVSGASFTPSIWSPTNKNAYAMTGSGTIPAVVAYQRRRKDNVGI